VSIWIALPLVAAITPLPREMYDSVIQRNYSSFFGFFNPTNSSDE
jgi:hypothetical protein